MHLFIFHFIFTVIFTVRCVLHPGWHHLSLIYLEGNILNLKSRIIYVLRLHLYRKHSTEEIDKLYIQSES